ncbi:hypothetical protein DE146DRAFT_753673 [Phaeosphaeria sp. MPI-PUGE-AT-0046c]|nr:hypothetical protein DE146DRAFT_753673 [Phaeosphaeria sp. MPI-PUGE-AT-0046c]
MALDEPAQQPNCSTADTDILGHLSSLNAPVYPAQNDSLLLQPPLSIFDEDDLSYHEHNEVDFDNMAISTPNFTEFEFSNATTPWITPELLFPSTNSTTPSPPTEEALERPPSDLSDEWGDSLSSLAFPLQTTTQPDKSPSSPVKSRTSFTKPQDALPAQCNCLHKLADLLNNVTETALGETHFPFDASLSYLRHSLQQCSRLVRCTSCISRSEFCLVVILTIEKIIFKEPNARNSPRRKYLSFWVLPAFSSGEFARFAHIVGSSSRCMLQMLGSAAWHT